MTTDAFARFRALHHRDGPLLLPNAWDRGTALALANAGFDAVGTTSLGVAAAAGKPDAAGATLDETLALAGIARHLPCPLTVDIEGGFGGAPAEVAELCARLAGLGVAGINLEDGRSGGALAAPDGMAAAIAAIKARVPELFVNARTDAYWQGLDAPLPETLRRVARYADAGADGVFVPAVADDADIAALVEAAPVPLNVLFLPAHHTLPHLAGLGVRRVSLGSLLYRAALDATVATARAVADGAEVRTDLPTYADVERLPGRAGG